MIQSDEYKFSEFDSTDVPNDACLPSPCNSIFYQVKILKLKVVWHRFAYLNLNLELLKGCPCMSCGNIQMKENILVIELGQAGTKSYMGVRSHCLDL